MNADVLSNVFKNYMSNRGKVTEIASHIDAVVKAALASPFGANLENADGFSDTPSDRQISTIRTKQPDEYGASSDLLIQIFAEGRAVVSTAWYQGEDMERQHREERVLYFSSQDEASAIAGRVLSAIVDTNNNDVAEAFSQFTRNTLKEATNHPTAES